MSSYKLVNVDTYTLSHKYLQSRKGQREKLFNSTEPGRQQDKGMQRLPCDTHKKEVVRVIRN